MAENIHLHAIRSFYSSRTGLMTLEDDVLSIVARVKEMTDGKITVDLDPDTGWFHLVEHCEDGTDRLVFSTEELDQRVLDRLALADSRNRYHEDPYDAVEREQDAIFAAQQEASLERVRDAGERLASVLKKDGLDDGLPLAIPVTRPEAHRRRSRSA